MKEQGALNSRLGTDEHDGIIDEFTLEDATVGATVGEAPKMSPLVGNALSPADLRSEGPSEGASMVTDVDLLLGHRLAMLLSGTHLARNWMLRWSQG